MFTLAIFAKFTGISNAVRWREILGHGATKNAAVHRPDPPHVQILQFAKHARRNGDIFDRTHVKRDFSGANSADEIE